MSYSIDTIPGDFPLGYVLDMIPNGHQLYVKERWHGLKSAPTCAYADCGGRNADGSVSDYWQMGCLMLGCKDPLSSVMRTPELIRLLKEGRIIGTYRDGLIVTISTVHP